MVDRINIPARIRNAFTYPKNSFMDFDSMWYYYEETPEERRLRVKAEIGHSNLIHSIIKFIGILLFLSFLYSSSLFASYFILRKMDFYLNLQNWEKVIAVLFLAYLISSFVFFLKGFMIILRAASNWWWVLIWFVCFVFVCLLPATAVYFILENMLGPSIPAKTGGIHNYQFWSLAGAIVAGGVIYLRYGLNRDNVIKISAWAYRMGKQAGRTILPPS